MPNEFPRAFKDAILYDGPLTVHNRLLCDNSCNEELCECMCHDDADPMMESYDPWDTF